MFEKSKSPLFERVRLGPNRNRRATDDRGFSQRVRQILPLTLESRSELPVSAEDKFPQPSS